MATVLPQHSDAEPAFTKPVRAFSQHLNSQSISVFVIQWVNNGVSFSSNKSVRLTSALDRCKGLIQRNWTIITEQCTLLH